MTAATLARSRQLAAVSENQLVTNLNVALPLAAQAYRTNTNPQTFGALLQANLFSPHLIRFLRMPGEVMRIAGSSDGKVVVAGLVDGAVTRWRFGQRTPTRLFRLASAVLGLEVSGSGNEIVATDGARAVLWRTDRAPATLRGPAGENPAAVAISPSGRTVAVAYHVPNRGRGDGAQAVVVFDVTRGLTRAVHALPQSASTPDALVAPSDTKLLLLSNGQWEWRRITDWTREGPPSSATANFGAQELGSYANDGSALAAVGVANGDPTIRVSRTKGRAAAMAPSSAEAPISAPQALTVSPRGNKVAVADSGTIYIASVARAGSVHAMPLALSGQGSVNRNGLRFVSDAAHLLSAGSNTIGIWDLHQVDRLAHVHRTPLAAYTCIACGGASVVISPDGHHVAVLDSTGSVVVHSLSGAQPAKVIKATRNVDNPNGSLFGPPVWAQHGRQLLLPLQAGKPEQMPSPTGSSPIIRTWLATKGSDLVAAGLSQDGRHVIAVDQSGNILEEDPALGHVIVTLARPRDLSGASLAPGNAAIDSADGLVATLGRLANTPLTASGAVDATWGAVTIRDVKAKRTVGLVSTGGIDSIAYAGHRLLVQRSNGRLEVWNARGKRLDRVLPGDQSYLVAPPVASANGALVARQRYDGTVLLTDLDTGSTRATLPAPAGPNIGLKKIGLGMSPDGTQLVETVQGRATPVIIQRDLSAHALIATACHTAGGPLTAAEWRAFVATDASGTLTCR